MLTHRGFSAWIVVDGETLPEYLVATDSEANKVSCLIPSEEGQTFAVFWKDHGGKVDTCAFITLDGFVVPGRFLFGEGVAYREGIRTSKFTERPFAFQKIDGTAEIPAETTSKDIGMIILRIKQIDRVSGMPANRIQEIPQTTIGDPKAGELRVGFGGERPMHEQYSTTWSVKPYVPDFPGARTASSYVTFVFRYRSREFLESQGIITPKSEECPPVTLPPVIKKASRRVVSLPSANMSPLEVSGLSPPRKLSSYYSVGPYQLRRRSIDTRRIVNSKAETTERKGQSVLGFVPFDEKTGRDGGMVRAED